MFDRFTKNAKLVLSQTRQEVLRLRHTAIGAEHMLLGLLRVEECQGARILRQAGADAAAIQRAVEDKTLPEQGQVTSGQLPFLANAKRALERTLEEAAREGAT